MFALQYTRRRLLGVSCATLASLVAGCSEEQRRSSKRETPEESDLEPDDAITDLEVEHLRAESGPDIVRFGDDDEHEREPRLDMLFLVDRDDLATLEFDREPDGTDDVRAFLEETDYDEETAVVHQRPVGECYERRVEYVRPTEESFDIRFCRVERAATVACEVSREELQATVVRFPFAYEDPPTDLGGGEGSNCRYPIDDRNRNAENDSEGNESKAVDDANAEGSR